MIGPPVLAESTDVVFVSFAPRTAKSANTNDNTAMIKSRMVGGVNRKVKIVSAQSGVGDPAYSGVAASIGPMSMSTVKSLNYFIGKAFPLCHFTDCFRLKRLKFLLQVFSV